MKFDLILTLANEYKPPKCVATGAQSGYDNILHAVCISVALQAAYFAKHDIEKSSVDFWAHSYLLFPQLSFRTFHVVCCQYFGSFDTFEKKIAQNLIDYRLHQITQI